MAFAAGFRFTLTSAVTLGSNNLKPGDYKVQVKGDEAMITGPDGRSLKTPARVEQSEQKFRNTLVGINSDGTLTEIDLGGSKTA